MSTLDKIDQLIMELSEDTSVPAIDPEEDE